MSDNTPTQYKQGYTEFYKLKFLVTPDVLIPRPETELLVDEVLKFITHYSSPITILDIGTGSGNISISVVKNTQEVKVIATDISKAALDIAKKNAKFHQVEDRIKFIQSDLLNGINPCVILVSEQNERSQNLDASQASMTIINQNDSWEGPDIVVTNLPYIPSYRIPYLDPGVLDYEPIIALNGGSDGFDLYRKLFAQIQAKNWKPKFIVGEIDYTQAEIAQAEAQKYFPNYQVEVKTDLTHKQRILIITR